MTWESNEELVHYGTKGQKWGVRRYQNEDGTLTAEGKARYGDEKEYDGRSIGRINNRVVNGNRATEMAQWREHRHAENKHEAQKLLDEANAREHVNQREVARRERKVAKYDKKFQAQNAANSNMEAYKKHRSTVKLMLTTEAYKHARARGSSRATAFLEGYTPLSGVVRAVNDKRRYGKFLVYGDVNGAEYDANAIR